MSAFKDMLKADSAAVFRNEDEFAESVVYMPQDGAPVRISAVIDVQPGQFAASETSEKAVYEVWVFIGRHPTQTGGGVAEPKIGDRLKAEDGTTYKVQIIDGKDADNWELICQRVTTISTGVKRDRN